MSRESRFIGINRIDRKCDALSLIRLANKFGVAKLSKIGSNGLEKLQDSDAAFADWIQCKFFFVFKNLSCIKIIMGTNVDKSDLI